MKKLWTLMMAMVFVLAVAGCGGEKAEPAAGGEGQSSESGGGLNKLKLQAPASAPVAEPAAPAEPAVKPAGPAPEVPPKTIIQFFGEPPKPQGEAKLSQAFKPLTPEPPKDAGDISQP